MQNLACCCCLQVAYKEVSPLFAEGCYLQLVGKHCALSTPGTSAPVCRSLAQQEALVSLLVVLCEREMGFALNVCLPGHRGCCGL